MRGYLNNVNFGSTNFTRQAAFLHGGTGQQHFAFGLQDATNMGHGGFGSFRLGLIQFFNRAITVDEIDRTFNLDTEQINILIGTQVNPITLVMKITHNLLVVVDGMI
jgi:hypothetical protein